MVVCMHAAKKIAMHAWAQNSRALANSVRGRGAMQAWFNANKKAHASMGVKKEDNHSCKSAQRGLNPQPIA